MGLYERDYSRDEPWAQQDSWRPASESPRGGGSGYQGPWSITTILIVINVVVFLLDMVLKDQTRSNQSPFGIISEYFSVRGDTLVKPWSWYRFLSYGFVHNNQSILHILFNMFGLFAFGRSVEERMGRAEYLRFYLVAVVFGGLIYSLRCVLMAIPSGLDVMNLPQQAIGASGAVMAVTILFAFYYPDAMILLMAVFPVKAWVAAVGFVVLNVIGAITSDESIAFDIHLAGAAFAAIYFRKQMFLGGYAPAHWYSALQRALKPKPKLRVHVPDNSVAKEEAEADRILAKISESGLDSLTRAERKTLERHSRRKRADRDRSSD